MIINNGLFSMNKIRQIFMIVPNVLEIDIRELRL
jgi:hypothetical protein